MNSPAYHFNSPGDPSPYLDDRYSVGVQVERSESPQVAEGRGEDLTNGVPGEGQVQQARHVGEVLPSDGWGHEDRK